MSYCKFTNCQTRRQIISMYLKYAVKVDSLLRWLIDDYSLNASNKFIINQCFVGLTTRISTEMIFLKWIMIASRIEITAMRPLLGNTIFGLMWLTTATEFQEYNSLLTIQSCNFESIRLKLDIDACVWICLFVSWKILVYLDTTKTIRYDTNWLDQYEWISKIVEIIRHNDFM